MELFIVGFLLGKIILTLGPLPPDMEECKFKASIQKAIVKGALEKLPEPMVFKGKEVTIENFEFKCEWHLERPEVEG